MRRITRLAAGMVFLMAGANAPWSMAAEHKMHGAHDGGGQSAAPSGDGREMVTLPAAMQEHMLGNMRDHLAALDDMLAALAVGDVAKASAVAEERLGMSSLSLHGADHLAPYMPKAMAAMGTEMHHAASRFVIAAQDAELNPGKDAQHKVYRALQDITANCNACHQSYRIR